MAAEEKSSEEEEGRDDVPSLIIRLMIGKREELHSFVEKHHPNKEVANRIINMFNDNAKSHFRQILKHK